MFLCNRFIGALKIRILKKCLNVVTVIGNEMLVSQILN